MSLPTSPPHLLLNCRPSLSPTAQTIPPQSCDTFTAPPETILHDILLLLFFSVTSVTSIYSVQPDTQWEYCDGRSSLKTKSELFPIFPILERSPLAGCRCHTEVWTGSWASRCGATHIVISLCTRPGSRSNLWKIGFWPIGHISN